MCRPDSLMASNLISDRPAVNSREPNPHAGQFPRSRALIALVIPAIVLAAGKSTRMGRTKALLPLPGGDSFLVHIVRTMLDAGVDDVVVVVGHDARAVVADVEAS